MIEINKNILELAQLIKPYATLYIVGGYVRDCLLNKTPNDLDLTSSLTISELEKVLKNTNFRVTITNKSFGTAKISLKNETYEYTTFRKDIYISGKHTPQQVEFVKNLTEDFSRRDFSINAMYYNILTNELIDPLNAKEDLNKKILKQVGTQTLNFDGERILRMVKYACILNFKIDRPTFLSAKQNYKNVYCLNNNMIQLYKQEFLSMSFLKKIRAKRLLKQLN